MRQLVPRPAHGLHKRIETCVRGDEWLSVEHVSDTNIVVTAYGRAFQLTGMHLDPRGWDYTSYGNPNGEAYCRATARWGLKLDLYAIPPKPPKPKRTWAKSMGLRRPVAKTGR